MKKMLLACLFVGLLCGCATKGQQAKTEGTGVGALLGAGLGAGLGYAFGGSQGAIIGAASGAVLGGAAGYAYADNIDKNNQELQSKENDINGQIQIAKNINGELQKNNQQVANNIQKFDADINSLKAKSQNEQDKQQKLLATKQKIDEEQNNVQKSLASAKTSLNELEKKRATNTDKSAKQAAELDAEIAKLNTTYNTTQQQSTELATMKERI